jgi:pyridoxine 5-phosphate synthase
MAKARPIRLGVNVDHVATLRNARGGVHPDPVRAAKAAVAAGADGITVHLREDRRHIRDDDVRRIKAEVAAPLNFELAATDEMVAIALDVRPHAACVVPEKRTERTTEGGLEVANARASLKPKIAKLRNAGIRVSLFIEPESAQIEAAAAIESAAIEIHTGAWCDAIAQGNARSAETIFEKIREGARLAERLGLEVHAGHGLDFATAEQIATVPEIVELNIGHFLVGEALFSGFDSVISSFRAAMERGRAQGRAA